MNNKWKLIVLKATLNSNGNEEGLKCHEKVWEYLDIHSHDVNQVRQKINGKQIEKKCAFDSDKQIFGDICLAFLVKKLGVPTAAGFSKIFGQ